MNRRWMFLIVLAVLPVCFSCSGSSGDAAPDGDGENAGESADADAADAGSDGDAEAPDGDGEGEVQEEEWEFSRDDYETVYGWIILDNDPEAVEQTIRTAADYGVNHIQLSHDLIMNIDDILGDGEEVQTRVDTLNLGIGLAHENGMKAYIWAHELSETPFDVCYDPSDPSWEQRRQAYRDGLAKLPGVDGVILMFGSAPLPPWFTVCTCAWCAENYPDAGALEAPPYAERIRIVTEAVGQAIVNELGKDLFVRTFVHEPNETAWHSEGLAAVRGVVFTGMHKGPVQDWQPYNPHDPCAGAVGPHPGIMEEDAAGEYYGLSALPFAAPGYFLYRLKYQWERNGIGAALRVQRGSNSALGTPNEINLYAVKRFLDDVHTPLETIWDDFLSSRYGLAPGDPGQTTLKRILKDTFSIRLKSHYVLGIWALSKDSQLPESVTLGEFTDRGDMPKWDPDWQETWDQLDRPDRRTVWWIWQEGSEAVRLAAEGDALAQSLQGQASPDVYADLAPRFRLQLYAAQAWRAAKLFIWSYRARQITPENPEFDAWMKWARADLAATKAAMVAEGLNPPVAGPSAIQTFLDATASLPSGDGVAQTPDGLLFSPVEVREVRPDGADLAFHVNRPVHAYLDWGLEIPDYGQTLDLGEVEADQEVTATLSGLPPNGRVVVRLRTESDDVEYRGGDFWIFTPEE